MQSDPVARGMTPLEDRPSTAQSVRREFYDAPKITYNANTASDQGPGPATVEVTPPSTAARPRTRTMQRAANQNGQEKERSDCLTADQTIELFQRKLEEARNDTQHVLSGTDEVAGAIKPTLTIDLGRSKIQRLPYEIIDLIIADVERLSLSHNALCFLPTQIADCKQLRYLNIRSNEFREIPSCIYSMPFLEILDVSKNKITKIPPEIKNLEALRVFSIVYNRLRDLPQELAELSRLKVLKVAENPFRKSIQHVIREKEQEVAYSAMTENEKDTALTTEIIKHLKKLKPSSVVTPVLENGELNEPQSAVEPSRLTRRALSGRFPVVPAAIPTEPSSETADGTLSQAKPPSLPVKSHLRGLSGQSNQGSLQKRPGIAPVINGNERNRSNSEGIIQASATRQQRRMGMVKRDHTQLDSIDETNVAKQNHFRGMSHASVLRRNGSISSPGGGSSSPNSPRDTRKDRSQQFVRRLSSLPEHKSDYLRRPLIEGAKGILYALYQVTPHIHGLIGPSKGSDARRSQLEMAFYAASQNVDKLNKSLEKAEDLDPEDEDAWSRCEEVINNDCAVCIKTFVHVTTQMQESTHKIVAGADPRYVRSLMLLLYGSIVEVKNAIKSFGFDIKQHRRQMSSGTTHPIDTIPEEPSSETTLRPNRVVRDVDDMTLRQPTRLRSDTVLKHPAPQNGALEPMPPPVLRISENMNLTSSTGHGTYSRSGSALGHNSNRGFASRSRSNSRSTTWTVNSEGASTVASTPRSTDSHRLSPMASFNNRLNSETGMTDAQEEQRFEQIFMALTKAYETALQSIPITIQHLERSLEAANEQRQAKSIIDIWTALVQKSRQCHELSQALQIRLTNMKVKDSGVGLNSAEGGRHDPSFWVLCKTFMSSYVVLLTEMKEVRKSRLLILPQDAVTVLRPVQKACQQAGHAITTSPWNHLLEGVNPMPAPTPFVPRGGEHPSQRPPFHRSVTVANSNVSSSYSSAFAAQPTSQVQYGHYPANSKMQLQPPGSALFATSMPSLATPTSVNVPSPLSANSPMPATPLSAALGPAAQATVPSTPASLYSDSFFKGDVFQRADSLLSMPQAAGVNFLNRR